MCVELNVEDTAESAFSQERFLPLKGDRPMALPRFEGGWSGNCRNEDQGCGQ